MLKVLIAFYFLLLFIDSNSQVLDHREKIIKEIQLSISTPQPRIDEPFEIQLDVEHLKLNILKSLYGKVELKKEYSHNNNLSMKIIAVKLGKAEIGPLEFTIDNVKYITNKITYEVVKALPNVDNGLWFRKVITSDTTFCIIVEQRVPTEPKITENSDFTTTFSSVSKNQFVNLKNFYSMKGVNTNGSLSNSTTSSAQINGERKGYMYKFSVYNFIIKDTKSKIIFTKDMFENIPSDFSFENIEI